MKFLIKNLLSYYCKGNQITIRLNSWVPSFKYCTLNVKKSVLFKNIVYSAYNDHQDMKFDN